MKSIQNCLQTLFIGDLKQFSLFEKLLKQSSYKSILFNSDSVSSAIRFFEDRFFDIIFIDEKTEDIFSNFEKLKKKSISDFGLTILIISDEQSSIDRTSVIKSGIDAFFHHPFEFSEFESIINIYSKLKSLATSRGSQNKIIEETLTFYKLLFEQSPSGIVLMDAEKGKTIEANKKAADQLGYTIEEFQNLEIKDYEASENTDETKKHLEIIRKNGFDDFETTHKTKNGEIRNVQVITRFFSLNERNYLLSIFHDITNQKKIEKDFDYEKNFSDAAINSLPGSLYLFDDQGKFLRWNKNFETVTEYSAKEISTMSPIDFFPPDEKGYIYQRILKVFETGQADAEAHLQTKTGKLILYYWTGKKLTFQGKFCLVGMGIDITQIYEAEKQLRVRNTEIEALHDLSKEVSASVTLKERVHSIIEKISKPVESDITLLFLKKNDTLNLHGSGPEHTKYKHEVTNIHRVGECLCGIAAVTGKPVYSTNILSDFRCTYEECKKAGLRSFASIPLVEGDEVVGVIGIGSATEKDFSQSANFLETAAKEIAMALKNAKLFDEISNMNNNLEKRIEERTIQLENANKEIESFSYSVSHDLRAPIRAIEGWSEALLDEYSANLDEKGIKYLTRICKETERMSRLIEDLLRLAKITKVDIRKTDVNLSGLVSAIFERSVDPESKEKIELNIQSQVYTKGDSNLLEVALTNLIQNSIKFSSKKPNAFIEFGEVSVPHSEKKVIYLRDNGAGFDMNYAEKLFAPFQRMHKKDEFPGTGIGLSIVQRIINKHNGNIWAESELGHGTTFYFTINL